MAICAYRSLANSTLGVEFIGAADVLEILLLVGGVDAKEEVIVRHLVHQDVVHESAVLIEQAGVLRLADVQFAMLRWW